MDWVQCFWCGKKYLKDIRHINENKKFGHKSYCSFNCQILAKSKKVEFICRNPVCQNRFNRQPKDISPNNFCSRSCAVSINNVKSPKKVAVIRKCSCGNRIFNHRKYCSTKCKSEALTINRDEIITKIRNFYKKYERIPVKREMWGIYKPTRKFFGTWNNAIEAAGFDQNPVLFAKHQVANDGHICDSIAEKLIDDYLFEKGISHERNVSYPEGDYTFDFKIGNVFIEYFGLAGEHKRYDELRKIKQRIARKCNLQFVEIYPKDLYPHSKLEEVLII